VETDRSELRIDSWVTPGLTISSNFDPMIAKVLAWAPTRDEAITRLAGALKQATVGGIQTNLPFLHLALAL
jgi:acetyl-CoA/propionyl-CoA carboxylase biotin carboxyl carrier protein